MFNNLPKKIVLAIMLIRALDLSDNFKLIQELIYLWREFFIKTKITPVIKEFIIEFYYRDNQLTQFRTKDLKELLTIAKQIKESRAEHGREI